MQPLRNVLACFYYSIELSFVQEEAVQKNAIKYIRTRTVCSNSSGSVSTGGTSGSCRNGHGVCDGIARNYDCDVVDRLYNTIGGSRCVSVRSAGHISQ